MSGTTGHPWRVNVRADVAHRYPEGTAVGDYALCGMNRLGLTDRLEGSTNYNGTRRYAGDGTSTRCFHCQRRERQIGSPPVPVRP
jgi:hypothetical protein